MVSNTSSAACRHKRPDQVVRDEEPGTGPVALVVVTSVSQFMENSPSKSRGRPWTATDNVGLTPQARADILGPAAGLHGRRYLATDRLGLTTDQKVGGSNPFGRALSGALSPHATLTPLRRHADECRGSFSFATTPPSRRPQRRPARPSPTAAPSPADTECLQRADDSGFKFRTTRWADTRA